jgi:hypothetical protein
MTEVYKRIAAITADMSKVGISKDGENKHGGYKFRGIDAVYGALSPMLAKHGLCILPRVMERTVTEQQSKTGGLLFYTVLRVEFDFVAAEDGSKHTVCTIGEAMDSGDKSTNKAMSAAYKYACFQAFCIPTDGDNDADAHTHEVVPVAKPALDTSGVDPAVVEAGVTAVQDALNRDQSETAQLLEIYDLHHRFGKISPEAYAAIADSLAKRGVISKANWKLTISAAKKLERDAA